MSNQTRSEGDFDALRVLIDCMEQMPPLTPAEVNGLHENHHEIFHRMIETGETWNQASSGPTFLSLNDEAFRDHMRKIDNDLGEQTAIVSQSFAKYLESGEIPAPYYPWRIAVILRRAQEPELERRFLAAWCRHFPMGNGQRYAQLIERYQKLL
jgi:hypothetical protein